MATVERLSFLKGSKARLGAFRRVVDRRTTSRLVTLGVVSVGVSLLEVIALAAIGPLVQLLGGRELDDGLVGSMFSTALDGMSFQGQALALLGFVVTLLVLRAALSAAVRWWTIRAVSEGSARATTGLLAAYLDAPLAFHAGRNSAAATRTAALSMTGIFANGILGISTVWTEVAVIAMVGLLLTAVTPVGAVAAIVYFSLAMLVYNRKIQQQTHDLARHRDEIQAGWLGLLQQSLGGLREIRMRHAEGEYTVAFRDMRARQNEPERRLMFNAEFGRYYLEAAFMIGFGVLASVILLTKGDDSAAVLGLLLAAGFRLLPSASRLLNALSRIREGEGNLETVLDELDAIGCESLADVDALESGHHLPAPAAGPMKVEFDDVSFTYPSSDTPAVDGLSGVVAPGRSLGIVGPSGSGKTTTVDLLCGLLAPSSGVIKIDGFHTDEQLGNWQRRIAYVPQDVFLLDGTIRQNIAFTTHEVDEDAVLAAIDLAQLVDWIDSLPAGLDTAVGERGVLLSGGQRQRIGIARALYRRPSLLVLDEATSALDVETEAYLSSAINGLAGGVTLIVVAHRLSTVRTCDDLMLLDDGCVVGWGSFDELSSSNTMFSRWVELAGMSKRAG